MLGPRQQRILAVLAGHPGGLAAENLLAKLRPGATLLERRRMLRALRSLKAAGLNRGNFKALWH